MIFFENEKKDILAIPISINILKLSLDENILKANFNFKFDQKKYLSEEFMNSLYKFVEEKHTKYKTIIIDMEFVDYYAARAFSNFKSLIESGNIVIININDQTELIKLFSSDLSSDKISIDNNMIFYYLNNKEVLENIEEDYKLIVKNVITEIVNYCTETKDQFLNSSSIWCNKYINLKKIFLNVDYTLIIVHQMSKHIINENDFSNYDALICTSKTGAAFANLLGHALSKKVVYCISIGPVFAVENNIFFDELLENKRYLYICDFICLGTEIKIINAIISRKKSVLVGGLGIASYIDLKQPELNNSILNRVYSLINVDNRSFNYKISNSLENLREIENGKDSL